MTKVGEGAALGVPGARKRVSQEVGVVLPYWAEPEKEGARTGVAKSLLLPAPVWESWLVAKDSG